MPTSSQYEQDIAKAALDNGLSNQLANLMVAQAKVETGNFTSAVFSTCNNAYGYIYVGQKNATTCGRKQASNDGGANYAAYNSVYDSADEVAKWIIRNVPNYNNINTIEDYANALKNSKVGAYFSEPASNYAASMAIYYKNIAVNTVKNNSIVASIIFVSIFAAISLSIYLKSKGKNQFCESKK